MDKNQKALELMQKARAQLVITERFYGVLTMHLELKPDQTCPTAWTDGITIGFNPDFVIGLSNYFRMFILIHEVKHCLLSHHLRRDSRDPENWNIACDRVIHYQLKHEEQMELLAGVLYNPADFGKSAEMIYNTIKKEQAQKQQQGQGNDQGDDTEGQSGDSQGQAGDGPGEVRDYPGDGDGISNSDIAKEEGKWTQALERAVKEAKGFGTSPGWADDLLEAKKKPKIDWKEVLHRWAEEAMDTTDYNWSKPNNHYDMYLPSLALSNDVLNNLFLIIDSSGSMMIESLMKVADELNSIIEEYKAHVTVIVADTEVKQVLEFDPDDLPLKFNIQGRGGTDFRPAFEHINKSAVTPSCVLYYTDGDGYFPTKEPAYPVLWIGTWIFKPPWGEFVLCD